jgi:hypothetical protein
VVDTSIVEVPSSAATSSSEDASFARGAAASFAAQHIASSEVATSFEDAFVVAASFDVASVEAASFAYLAAPENSAEPCSEEAPTEASGDYWGRHCEREFFPRYDHCSSSSATHRKYRPLVCRRL